MDLNLLYSEHQRFLIRASGASDRLQRTRHLAAAESLANRIRDHQLICGAAAASGWLRAMNNLDHRAGPFPGIAR